MLRSSVVVTSLFVALVAVASPSAARADCASAVVVDGNILLGSAVNGERLPPTRGAVSAVAPGCSDGGAARDAPTTVLRLRGLPPTVAVLSRRRDTLYTATGTLTALQRHPLHAIAPPPPRRGASCHPVRVRAKATSAQPGRIALAGGDVVLIDDATRLTNRPAYQPVRAGQRLTIAASRCGHRLFADRIAFRGHTPPPERYVPASSSAPRGPGGGGGFPWILAGVAAALIAAAAALLTRRRG